MSLFGILLVIAVVTAIPTSGLSLVALYFAKRWINGNEAKQIAAAAINARSQDQTITIPFVSGAGTRVFFNRYGSTEKKFESLGGPSQIYIGYVRVESSTEHVVMVASSGSSTYVSSFMPPYQFGNDFLSLAAKSDFLKSIVSTVRSS